MQIQPFDTVYGRNLLAEVPNFAHSPTLIVTMQDLWPKFLSSLPIIAILELSSEIENLINQYSQSKENSYDYKTSAIAFPVGLSLNKIFSNLKS